MYYMKNIINHNEDIPLPMCMYHVKNPNESLRDEIDLINDNISSQVMKFLKVPKTKMAELEQRQDKLIKKLDILYDRIKVISSICNTNSADVKTYTSGASNTKVPYPDEVVLVANPDNLPYYLIKILRNVASVNLSWHIHSSVPNEKVPKITGFVKGLKNVEDSSKVNLRLIFKSVSPATEMKLSSLSEPIVGTVNILRYLSSAYPQIIPYEDENFKVDSLLDICYLLEKSSERNKESLFKKLFSESQAWIYGNDFTILDLAAYNLVKQSKNLVKYVPKAWFDKCEKLCS